MRAGSPRTRSRSARREAPRDVAEHVLDPEERRLVEPRLAHSSASSERHAASARTCSPAWRLFFERLAETYPVLIVFEDLQWADDALLDFIEYLLDWSRNSPIFVITLARPELLERRPTWGAGQRNFTSLYLEPLPPTAWRSCCRPRARACPRRSGADPRSCRGRPALRGRDRPDAPRSRTARPRGAVYGPTGTIDALDVPRRCTR